MKVTLMKREYLFEQRQTADRMEATMIVASFAGLFGAALVLMFYGLAAGLCAFLLCALGFAISRLFHLFSALFACMQELVRDMDAGRPPENKD